MLVAHTGYPLAQPSPAAAVWNLVSYLLPQLVALPGLTPRQAVIESHTSTAVGNLLPAGQAVGLGVTYRFYSSFGFPPSQIAQSLLIQGVWNSFVKLGMPIVALGLLVLTGQAAGELAPVAVIGAVVFGSALAAFAFVRLLSAFPITPGGLGAVELGLAAVLVVAGGEKAKVVAAVLVFRVLTFLLPMPVGALTYWLWRRAEGRRRTTSP